VGSSEEYGDVPSLKEPFFEDRPLNPSNPYAVARVSQELISKVYIDGFKLNIIMTRSFNHLGTGQRDIFVISSFAKQLCQIKLNLRDKIVETGDINIVRDFIDVRDVVDAYYRLLMHGRVGEVYNVCSGRGIAIKDVIKTMCEILDIDVEIRTKDELVRPTDNRVIIGSNEKLKKEMGWSQKFTMRESLSDVITFWMNKLGEKI
jgi:GDP-4-dehydro-6-deoxy-D-mannose reductase